MNESTTARLHFNQGGIELAKGFDLPPGSLQSIAPIQPIATYTDADVERFLENADRWAKQPSELGEWLTKRLMTYTQVLDHMILHPAPGKAGLVATIRAAQLQLKTAVVIHEAMIRLKLKEATPAKSRAQVSGRPAHRGRSGRRSPVGG